MAELKTSYHHGNLRSALLDAAASVISEIGPQGLTIREVASRAGVSHAAPYRHFSGKDEILLAAVEQGFALLEQTMADCKAAADSDPISQFAASGIAYVDFALQHSAYYRVMFSGNLLSAGGELSLEHTSRETLLEMVRNIEQCQALGIVRQGDAQVFALTIWSTIHGFVSLANDGRLEHLLYDEASAQVLRDAVLSAIFQGLGQPLDPPPIAPSGK